MQGDDDIGISASRLQTQLRQCWEHFTNEFVPAVRRRRPFVLVLNGDLIEGVHHGGKQLIWNSEPRHAEIAIELLRPLASKAKAVYCVAGTECHTKSWEEHIGKALGAVLDETTDRYAPDDLDLNVRGYLTSFRHHTSTSARRGLQATKLGVQLVEEQSGAAGSQTPVPRVVVRSHCHVWGSYKEAGGHSIVVPAWQCFTRYTHKAAPAAKRMLNVGGIVLDYSLCTDPKDLPAVFEKLYWPT